MTNDTDTALRLFIALPADAAGEALRPARERLASFSRAIRMVAPDNYHLTLKFIGRADAHVSRRLIEDFRSLKPGVGPIPYAMKGLGAFPHPGRPRVIWCGLIADPPPLRRLLEIAEETAARHGFMPEGRPFRPHLTLARARGDRRMPAGLGEYLAAHADFDFGESMFDRIVLFRSEIGKDGARYTPEASVRLEG